MSVRKASLICAGHRPSNALIAFIAAASFGCAGGGTAGDSSAVVPSVVRSSVGPESAVGSPISGFDASGNPVFLAVSDADPAKWTVYTSKDAPLYDIPVTGAVASYPGAVSGKYLVGDFVNSDDEYAVFVAYKDEGGSVVTATYPGYSFSVCDGGKALVYQDRDGDNPPYFLLDLATGTISAEPLPAGAVPYAMKGSYALCDKGGDRSRQKPAKAKTRSAGGALVYDISKDTSVDLQSPAGADGGLYAYVLNSKGQVLGVSYSGEKTDLRLWNASGVPGSPLDSVTGGSLEPGWLSEDGRKMSYGKVVDGVGTAHMRVGSSSYALRSDTFALSSLYGLNLKGTAGFGYDSDLEAYVQVSVSYR